MGFFLVFFLKYQSHMAFSSLLPFLLPTHSVDCAVHLLLSHSRALLVSSALFNPFTALIMPFFFTALKCPFDGPFTALKCPFDGPFIALKCPFQMAPCPFENLGRTLTIGAVCKCVFILPSSHFRLHDWTTISPRAPNSTAITA